MTENLLPDRLGPSAELLRFDRNVKPAPHRKKLKDGRFIISENRVVVLSSARCKM